MSDNGMNLRAIWKFRGGYSVDASALLADIERLEAEVARLRGQAAVANERADRLLATLTRAEQDINWMLNNRQFLNPDAFDYLHEAVDGAAA